MVLNVEDDGKGFDLDKTKRGNGLNNIKQRTIQIGGSFNIFSKPKKGTKIQIEIEV